MLDNPTPSVPTNKVSDYELLDNRVKLYSKILVQPNYPINKTYEITGIDLNPSLNK